MGQALPERDMLQRFVFENTDIRGAVVVLQQSVQQLFEGQSCGAAARHLLKEFIAANVLMTSHLKFDGLLSLQAKSPQISLLMSECTHDLAFRAIAEGELGSTDFASLFRGGTLALTIQPQQGQRYQGIVPLERANLGACLQDYFQQSEQLPSFFLFLQTAELSFGLMLQALPAQICKDLEQRELDWERLCHLASTISVEEAASLAFRELLYRLFHEEQVRIFDAEPVRFECSCSRERMERALLTLGKDELMDVLAAEHEIKTQCHFCHHEYRFSAGEIQQLLQGGTA